MRNLGAAAAQQFAKTTMHVMIEFGAASAELGLVPRIGVLHHLEDRCTVLSELRHHERDVGSTDPLQRLMPDRLIGKLTVEGRPTIVVWQATPAE